MSTTITSEAKNWVIINKNRNLVDGDLFYVLYSERCLGRYQYDYLCLQNGLKYDMAIYFKMSSLAILNYLIPGKDERRKIILIFLLIADFFFVESTHRIDFFERTHQLAFA